jgi:hypothetical protein
MPESLQATKAVVSAWSEERGAAARVVPAAARQKGGGRAAAVTAMVRGAFRAPPESPLESDAGVEGLSH